MGYDYQEERDKERKLAGRVTLVIMGGILTSVGVGILIPELFALTLVVIVILLLAGAVAGAIYELASHIIEDIPTEKLQKFYKVFRIK